MKEAVDDFLAQQRIAVAGVSRSGREAANFVYRKLRGAGYQVYPVNPAAQEVEGDACYPDIKSIPDGVDGVVISTPPAVADQIVRECAAAGIARVWMHRSFGRGSVSQPAVRFCREHGIAVIPGGCPMMFCAPVDFPHKCMRWVLNLTGGLPKEV
ncbi:MAG: CoA-binding protein [Gemmatimonadales bacterium]|nr:CoA-binding protein [Gemmatimonadales bacterium]NIN48668.1 CoA-binding protein [Gemmatimonadales bacterium]NIP06132.1 CoA-binding protein [Gemmatimonadales bacterium]NIR01306.1 CoA-binding protein [Gemmatimonadales bacterium]